MKNFKIYDSSYTEPEPVSHWFAIGTSITFRNVGGQIKAAIQIPVQYA